MYTPEEMHAKKCELQNDVYAAIVPAYMDIETRGQNSHQAAQAIAQDVGNKFIQRFSIEEQKAYLAKYGEPF